MRLLSRELNRRELIRLGIYGVLELWVWYWHGRGWPYGRLAFSNTRKMSKMNVSLMFPGLSRASEGGLPSVHRGSRNVIIVMCLRGALVYRLKEDPIAPGKIEEVTISISPRSSSCASPTRPNGPPTRTPLPRQVLERHLPRLVLQASYLNFESAALCYFSIFLPALPLLSHILSSVPQLLLPCPQLFQPT